MQPCVAVEAEEVAAAAATGDSGADAGAVGAAGTRTAPVAVETEIGSTQQDVACGRVGPARYTQGATALAARSRLMRKRKEEFNEGTLHYNKSPCMHTHAHILFSYHHV